MSERFPWEDAEPSDAAATADAATRPEPASQTRLQLDADHLTTDDGTPPEPELQPDGDPREMEETGSTPADVEPDAEEVPDTGARPAEPSQTPRHGDPLRHAGRERPVARKEYYSIGEVSELVGLPAHVLRYWESQFAVLNPSKNRSGNRAYQRKEIRLILLVKHLLYEEKYTVEGAKARLDQLRRGGAVQERTAAALDAQTLALLREDVAALRELTAEPA